MADYLNIAGRVRTTASDGVAMEAQEVKDLNLNKSQQEVNADVQTELGDRYTKEETYNREELNELITTPDVNRVYVIATNLTTAVTDLLPATGSSDTLYNVGNWDGTQYDTTVYSIYGWDGTAYVCLAVRSFIGEVYDISANHPDGQGNPTPYADLTAALGTGGANVPVGIRRGGMSIKFIQGTAQSSDNKYVQFRYMSSSTATADFVNVANWQGIDDEPTAGSRNLVESGGVKAVIDEKTAQISHETLSSDNEEKIEVKDSNGNTTATLTPEYSNFKNLKRNNKDVLTEDDVTGFATKQYVDDNLAEKQNVISEISEETLQSDNEELIQVKLKNGTIVLVIDKDGIHPSNMVFDHVKGEMTIDGNKYKLIKITD